jgi:sirohydrochlorin ferrochelatase
MTAPLIIAAHGSRDTRFVEVVESLADLVRIRRPDTAVQVGYLDHNAPRLADLDTRDAVVVPLLLSTGFHVRVDIPTAAPHAVLATAVGPDPALAAVLADRLREAGWNREEPVVLAAAGSADEQSNADVRAAAQQLGDALGLSVGVAFVSGGTPSLGDIDAAAVASYVLAAGHFAAQIAGHDAIISAPIGADPRVADVICSRYDAKLGLQ